MFIVNLIYFIYFAIFKRSVDALTGSGRVFSGFGIWPKCKAGIGKTVNILARSGIWLFPRKRDSPKTGHGMWDSCLRVGQECRKQSRPPGSSCQSKSTRRVLSGVSFQTTHPIGCLVNRSLWLTVREYFVSIRCQKIASGVMIYQLLTRYIP